MSTSNDNSLPSWLRLFADYDDSNNNDDDTSSSSSSSISASSSSTTVTTAEASNYNYNEWYLQKNALQFDFPITFANDMDYKECEMYYATVHPERYNDLYKQNEQTIPKQKRRTIINRKSSMEFFQESKEILASSQRTNNSNEQASSPTTETTRHLRSCLRKPPTNQRINHDYKGADTHFPMLVERKENLKESIKKLNESWCVGTMDRRREETLTDDFNISKINERLHQSLVHFNTDEYVVVADGEKQDNDDDLNKSHLIDDEVQYNYNNHHKMNNHHHVSFEKNISVTTIYPFYELPSDIWYSIWIPHEQFRKQMKQSKKEYKEEKKRDKEEKERQYQLKIRLQQEQERIKQELMDINMNNNMNNNNNNSANSNNNRRHRRVSAIEQELFDLPLDDNNNNDNIEKKQQLQEKGTNIGNINDDTSAAIEQELFDVPLNDNENNCNSNIKKNNIVEKKQQQQGTTISNNQTSNRQQQLLVGNNNNYNNNIMFGINKDSTKWMTTIPSSSSPSKPQLLQAKQFTTIPSARQPIPSHRPRQVSNGMAGIA